MGRIFENQTEIKSKLVKMEFVTDLETRKNNSPKSLKDTLKRVTSDNSNLTKYMNNMFSTYHFSQSSKTDPLHLSGSFGIVLHLYRQNTRRDTRQDTSNSFIITLF